MTTITWDGKMTRVAVVITTDHQTPFDAAESVMNILRKAGYDVDDGPEFVPQGHITVRVMADVVINAKEPEVAEYGVY